MLLKLVYNLFVVLDLAVQAAIGLLELFNGSGVEGAPVFGEIASLLLEVGVGGEGAGGGGEEVRVLVGELFDNSGNELAGHLVLCLFELVHLVVGLLLCFVPLDFPLGYLHYAFVLHNFVVPGDFLLALPRALAVLRLYLYV